MGSLISSGRGRPPNLKGSGDGYQWSLCQRWHDSGCLGGRKRGTDILLSPTKLTPPPPEYQVRWA